MSRSLATASSVSLFHGPAHINSLNGVSAAVDILPIAPEELTSGVVTGAASVARLSIGVSQRGAPEGDWLEALRRSARHTTRSLSFPSHSGKYLSHGPSVDREADTKTSLMSILAAGLPMPKSPSIQIAEAEAETGGGTSDSEREREERGWWALRFQQVQREMQRTEGPIALNLDAPPMKSPVAALENGHVGVKPSAASPLTPILRKKSSGIPRRR